MSPFDGKSCLDFYIRLTRNRREWSELRAELDRHADLCDCPCPVCVRLRELAETEER
jgi:hypothetical protein